MRIRLHDVIAVIICPIVILDPIPPDRLVHDRFHPPNQPEPNLSSLPPSLSLVVSKKAATTGRPQPSCRVEEKSDRDAQFTLVALTLRSRCRTNELTSAIHRIDRSGNGCARTDAITIRLGSCIDMEGLERSKIRESIFSIRFVFDINVYYPRAWNR